MTLTLKKVEKLKHEPGKHFDSDGLYLKIQPLSSEASSRANLGSWILRYQVGGRERYCGLGRLADFDLLEARELARKARQQLRDGVDPIAARQADKAQRALEEAKAITFEYATAQYISQHIAKWKNPKTPKNFEATMTKYVFPVLGPLAVAAIDTGLVLKVLEPIWSEMPVTADRIRGRKDAVRKSRGRHRGARRCVAFGGNEPSTQEGADQVSALPRSLSQFRAASLRLLLAARKSPGPSHQATGRTSGLSVRNNPRSALCILL